MLKVDYEVLFVYDATCKQNTCLAKYFGCHPLQNNHTESLSKKLLLFTTRKSNLKLKSICLSIWKPASHAAGQEDGPSRVSD